MVNFINKIPDDYIVVATVYGESTFLTLSFDFFELIGGIGDYTMLVS